MKAEIENLPFHLEKRGIEVTSETADERQHLELLWTRRAAGLMFTRNDDGSVTLTIGPTADFDKWYQEFQKELAEQSGTGVIPKGMDKESYQESFNEGMTPAERASQELDDLSR